MSSCKGMDHKHCRWELGTRVLVKTPQGYLEGKVFRHGPEHRHRCTVEFAQVVDMGDANGARYCHVIPFRSMRRADRNKSRPSKPWYKEDPYGSTWSRTNAPRNMRHP